MVSRISCIAKCYAKLTECRGPIDIENITPLDLRHLRNSMTGYSDSTLQNYLFNFGSFLKFATGMDTYRDARIRFNGIEYDRVWISKDDWKILFDNSNEMEKLILALGGSMGLRRMEIVSIKLEDIKGNILTVKGKGTGNGKIVDTELSALVLKCLGPYIEWRKNILELFGDRSEGYLFICPFEKNLGKPLTTRSIGEIVSNLEQKSGIRWTLHSLRRLFCMTMVDAGIDLDTTRRMMRHASVDTTLNAYIRVDPRKIRDAGDAVNKTFATITD